MKAGIHPKFNQAKVTCGCGNTFVVGSIKENIEVEICGKCHPFFTGEMRFLDTMGRVEKFQKKMNVNPSGEQSMSKKARKALKKKQEDEIEAAKPKNLKEMFDRVRPKV